MLQEDLHLLKGKLSSHATYRQFSGDGDVSWMSRLQKSGLASFQLLEARCIILRPFLCDLAFHIFYFSRRTSLI